VHNLLIDNSNREVNLKPKMLFANDESFMIEVYRRQFEDLFEVEIAENGMQAV